MCSYRFVILRNIGRNLGFRDDQVEQDDAALSQPLDGGLDARLHVLHDVQEHGVVNLVDGVVGAEDAKLLADAVVHQRVLEVHAESADQLDQHVLLHVGHDLENERKSSVLTLFPQRLFDISSRYLARCRSVFGELSKRGWGGIF